MSVEEILVGLQNAIARGQSLEKAVNSLILAGYNPQEVQQAVAQINQGVISRLPQNTIESKEHENLLVNSQEPQTQYKKLPAETSTQPFQPQQTTGKKKIPRWAIITAITTTLIVLAVVIISIVGLKILGATN